MAIQSNTVGILKANRLFPLQRKFHFTRGFATVYFASAISPNALSCGRKSLAKCNFSCKRTSVFAFPNKPHCGMFFALNYKHKELFSSVSLQFLFGSFSSFHHFQNNLSVILSISNFHSVLQYSYHNYDPPFSSASNFF